MSLQNPDPLEVRNLRTGILDPYMGSQQQRADVVALAEEVRRRYVAKVPKDSGNLASTARVVAKRSPDHVDRRYSADFEVGGPRADYAAALEAREHILAQVLRDMGYAIGDLASGPRGFIPRESAAPNFGDSR